MRSEKGKVLYKSEYCVVDITCCSVITLYQPVIALTNRISPPNKRSPPLLLQSVSLHLTGDSPGDMFILDTSASFVCEQSVHKDGLRAGDKTCIFVNGRHRTHQFVITLTSDHKHPPSAPPVASRQIFKKELRRYI